MKLYLKQIWSMVKSRLSVFRRSSRIKRKPQETKQSEAEYYTELFTANKEWSKPTPNRDEGARWQAIEKLILHLKSCDSPPANIELKILDVGCGRGWLTFLMSKHGSVQGIEPVAAVVDHGKRLFPTLDISSRTTRDLLVCHKHHYDLVVSSEVMEHIPDGQKLSFVRDIHDLIRASGFAIITTPRKEAQSQWVTPGQPIEEWMDEIALEKLFTENGFKAHICIRVPLCPYEGAAEIPIYQAWLFQKV